MNGITKRIKVLVWDEMCNICNVRHSVKKNSQCKYTYKLVMNELIQKISKDKLRKVCKGCYEIGHNMKDIKCKINIDKNLKLKEKIKKYILSQDCLSGKTNDEHFEEISKMLDITVNMCKTLYDDIPPIELCYRPLDVDKYIHLIKQDAIKCHQCCKCIYDININTNHIWKGNTLCDNCWAGYVEERNALWDNVHSYKKIQCTVCSLVKTKEGERFHYDHINMFDKCNSICTMVNEGNMIDDIYKEIDKCQILCLSCHHIVTDIEHKLAFSRIKQILTRRLNNGEISDTDYQQEKIKIGEVYIKKMFDIYELLKTSMSTLSTSY